MTSDNAEYKLISAEGTEARVCQDIAKRQQLGIAKYGQTVANNPLELRAWLQHAYEETLDKAVYLRRAIEEMDASTKTGAHVMIECELRDVTYRRFPEESPVSNIVQIEAKNTKYVQLNQPR